MTGKLVYYWDELFEVGTQSGFFYFKFVQDLILECFEGEFSTECCPDKSPKFVEYQLLIEICDVVFERNKQQFFTSLLANEVGFGVENFSK